MRVCSFRCFGVGACVGFMGFGTGRISRMMGFCVITGGGSYFFGWLDSGSIRWGLLIFYLAHLDRKLFLGSMV